MAYEYEIEVTISQSLTELQLAKDSNIQPIPLTNEEYVKQLEDE